MQFSTVIGRFAYCIRLTALRFCMCHRLEFSALSTMNSSSMNDTVRVRNWPITVNYSFYIRLWLVNFLLLQPHPYCYCSL